MKTNLFTTYFIIQILLFKSILNSSHKRLYVLERMEFFVTETKI